MKALCAALIAAAILSGCTAQDAIDARRLTIEDGTKFVDENHEWRRQIREHRRSLVNQMFEMYKARAAQALANDDYDQAAAMLREADDVLRAAYPRVATIEALREGIDSYDEMRSLFRELDYEESAVDAVE